MVTRHFESNVEFAKAEFAGAEFANAEFANSVFVCLPALSPNLRRLAVLHVISSIQCCYNKKLQKIATVPNSHYSASNGKIRTKNFIVVLMLFH
jgi:hypothetical protein